MLEGLLRTRGKNQWILYIYIRPAMGARRELIGSVISKGKGHDASGQYDCLPYNESINFLGWRAEVLLSSLPSQRSVEKSVEKKGKGVDEETIVYNKFLFVES